LEQKNKTALTENRARRSAFKLKLFSLGSLNRTYTCTGAAVDALVLNNHVLAIAFLDSAGRTFICTSAASDTIVGNYICHSNTPPYRYVWIITVKKLL